MRLVLGLGAFIATAGFRFYHQHLSRWSGEPQLGGFETKTYKHKGRITEIRVGVNRKAPFEFIVRPEKAWDVTLKRIGLAEEIQTGEQEFDNAFYIVSDEVELAHRLKNESRLRQTVKDIFALGPTELHIGKGKLWVRFQNNLDGVTSVIEQRAGELLLQLAEQLGASRSMIETARKQSNIWKAAALMACHLGFLVAGIGMLVFCRDIVDFWHLVFSAAAVGLLLSVSWGLVICAVMDKSARVNLVLFDLVVVGVAGICMASAGGLAAYNIEYDTSQPEKIYSQIVDKYSRKHRKSGRSYYVCVKYWKKEGDSYCFKVSSSAHSSANIGSSAQLTLRAGALGYEWLEKYQFTVAR